MLGWGHWAGMWTPGRWVSENSLQQLHGPIAPSPLFILHNCWPFCLYSPWRISSHFPEHRWISEMHNGAGDCQRQPYIPLWQQNGGGRGGLLTGETPAGRSCRVRQLQGIRQRKPTCAVTCGYCLYPSISQVSSWHHLMTRCTKTFITGFHPSFPATLLCA